MTSAPPLFQVECGTADKPASSHVGPIPGQCTLLNAPALPVSLSSSLASLPRVKRDFTRREVAVQACDRPTHTCSMYMLGGLRHGLIVDCTSLPDRPPPPPSFVFPTLYSQDKLLEIGFHYTLRDSGGNSATMAFPPPKRKLITYSLKAVPMV